MKNEPHIPQTLLKLIEDGTWVQPSDEKIEQIAPCFRGEELDFCLTKESIIHNSNHELVNGEVIDNYFREYTGSKHNPENSSKWRDVEKSIVIAVNRHPGDDIAIALDYRQSKDDPKVIGSDWTDDENGIQWKIISNTMTQFLEKLGHKMT